MFSPAVQLPEKTYPSAFMRAVKEEPPAPVWEKVSVSSIHLECLCAASTRSPSKASGCLGAVEIWPAFKPWFRLIPSREASAVGLARALLISSSKN